MTELSFFAGMTSTTLFVVSYLPMLYRALRTRDLGSYSRPSLVLANVGNVVQAIYVYSLPLPARRFGTTTHHQGGRHDGDDN